MSVLVAELASHAFLRGRLHASRIRIMDLYAVPGSEAGVS